MDAGFEAHLRVGGETVDERDAALLRAVAAEGSLNAAASALGRSYSRAHGRIGDLEDAAGPLVERRRGGSEGGGSRLTDEARELLAEFDRLQAALSGTAATERLVLDGRVAARDGDLATVETATGTVRALALTDADDVRVAFRSDAVTLHAPESAPEGGETSARNRFRGEVVDVDRGEGTALVRIDVGAEDPLVVRVTETSLDGLGLEPGVDVVASFKATATRATAAPGATEPNDPNE
ncbi:transcriptional regulator, ModE family protein [Halosimplex carlsbadense 2-9-1]|uniref:Transcriptional regulator, ModE family protein n=1 Tax=Halosimplex carlsbadense 2-9-1 TaxID=797114 RepID=M0CP28_9EURY|nr:TOBE domain-containing protein [Halosimplex carlsbadense]ELZ23624.1 transcriptional regulator, ModE family protein [Halosimplex carlsbadense 2-9-1]